MLIDSYVYLHCSRNTVESVTQTSNGFTRSWLTSLSRGNICFRLSPCTVVCLGTRKLSWLLSSEWLRTKVHGIDMFIPCRVFLATLIILICLNSPAMSNERLLT